MLGAHLLFRLVQGETKVRAIYRSQEGLDRTRKIFSYYTQAPEALLEKVEWIQASLNDIPALETTFVGITQVYHAAALISFDPKDYKKLHKINVEGTANVVNLCLAHGIQKLCHVSSIAAVGRPLMKGLADEETEWTDRRANVYALSKYASEMEVWRGTQEGLQAVVVNPGLILGPGQWNSGSGKLFATVAKGLRYAPPGGTGFVGVDEVVQGMLQAMESDRSGERFILVGQNRSHQEILACIANGLGVKGPSKVLQKWQLEMLWRLDALRCFFAKKERLLTKNGAWSLLHPVHYSHDKAKQELQLEFAPIEAHIAKYCPFYEADNP